MVTRILLDPEACVFCLNCVSECPEDMFEIVGHMVRVKNDGMCYNACFECEDFCRGFAITIDLFE